MNVRLHPCLLAPCRLWFALFTGWLFALTFAGHAQTLAFPGALGFGEYATGGRNGTVYHVTSLADSGTGTFRDAVSSGNRTIVFDVGGTITLASAVTCSSSLTIAGQTAPGGIAIIGHEVSFSVRSNCIVRYLRIRPGSLAASTEDGINMGDATNMIFDHVSVEFAPYNNIDAHGNYSGGNQITMMNSILADPIGQQFNAHTEALYNSFSWIYDILSSAHNRNPLAKVNDIFVNNIVYNFQAGYTVADTSGNFDHDIINNYFITGPSTSSAGDDFFQMDANQSVYAAGNLLDSANNGTLGGSSAVPGGVTTLSAPWSPVTTNIPTFSTVAAYKKDVSLSGALPRDPVDQLVINDVTSLGTSGSMWTSQTATGLGNSGYGTLTGGATPLNTSGDGIPDYWKLANGMNVSTAYPLTNGPDGYTPLEHYLNWVALPHASTSTNTAVSIALSPYAAGFGSSPAYTVGTVSNGVVVLTNSSTAIFTPTAGFTGFGSFAFIVNDGTTAQTNTISIAVSSIPVPLSLTWRGDGTADNWDTTSTNWYAGTNREVFAADDTVTFDNTGSNSPAINLVGTLTPAAINVVASQNYTFSGSGTLSGTATFTKSGTGTLTINTTNSGYSGNYDVSGGTLALNNGGSLGSGNLILSSNATLSQLTGTLMTISGNVTVAAGNTATLTSTQEGNEFGGSILSGDANSVLNLVSAVSFNSASPSTEFSGFTGTINIESGATLRFALADSGESFGSLNPNFLINGTLQPRNAGNTITLGCLNGAGQLTGPQTSGTGSGNTLYVIGGNNQGGNFSGTIISNSASAGSVVCFDKVGTGTQILSGNNTITGTNAVLGGTLVLNGSNLPSLLSVFTNATLAGTGSVSGAVSVLPGGSFAPGTGTNVPGTFTITGSLALTSPNLLFDLSSSPAGPNDQIVLNGGWLTLTNTLNWQFNLLNGSLGNGTYQLITGATNISASNVTLADNLPAGARQTFTLSRPAAGSNTGYVALVVSGLPAASLLWRGTNGSAWDLATTNWQNGTAPDMFYNLDSVTFNDSSTNGNPGLNTTLQPNAILVSNNATAYTFAGAGALTGSGSLTKAGPGTLTIATTNSAYTGSLAVTGGTLAFQNLSALGSGPITLSGGGSLDLLYLATTFYIGNPVAVAAGQSGNLAAGALGSGYNGNFTSGNSASVLNLTTGVSVGGTSTAQWDGFTGTVNVQSGNLLRFAPNSSGNTYGSANPTFNVSGTLQPRNAGNTIELGALTGSGTIAGAQSASGSGDTVYVIGGNNASTTFAGSISSNSAIASTVDLNKVGTGTLTLTGPNTYTGSTTVSAGTLCVNSVAGSGSGSLEVFAGATLAGNGSIGAAATVDNAATLAPGSPTGTLTFTNSLALGNSSTLLFALGTNSSQVVVSNSLYLAGVLNVTNSVGFGVGTYPLFTCVPASGLSYNVLTFGTLPAGYNYSFNTNTAGVVNLIVAPTNGPQFTGLRLAGTSLVCAGTNGTPFGNYVLLTTTNVTLPIANWTRLLTNQFNAGGGFALTNSVGPNPQGYFRLLAQ